MARQEWSKAGELEDGLAQLTTRISDEVTEALVGTSSTQAGWAMFAFGMNLIVSAEAWAATVSASRGELGKGDVHRAAELGVRSTADLLSRAGDSLIARGEGEPAADREGGFSPDERLRKARPDAVASARTWLRGLVPRDDELLGEVIGTIRGADDSLVDRTARALPGLGRTQAGWGLMVSGSLILQFVKKLPEPASESTGGRWGRGRRRQLREAVAGRMGMALDGAVFVLAGDALAPEQ